MTAFVSAEAKGRLRKTRAQEEKGWKGWRETVAFVVVAEAYAVHIERQIAKGYWSMEIPCSIEAQFLKAAKRMRKARGVK